MHVGAVARTVFALNASKDGTEKSSNAAHTQYTIIQRSIAVYYRSVRTHVRSYETIANTIRGQGIRSRTLVHRFSRKIARCGSVAFSKTWRPFALTRGRQNDDATQRAVPPAHGRPPKPTPSRRTVFGRKDPVGEKRSG